MSRRRLILALSLPVGLAAFVLACEDSDGVSPPATPDGSTINLDASGTPVDSGPGTNPDSGRSDGGDGGSPCTGRFPIQFWDGGVLLVPSPYREAADSPFACVQFASYYHLATFEGDGGLPPGTSGPGAKYPGTGISSGITDSVDGDDGFPDGAPPDSGSTVPCPGCQSFFGTSMDFVFDEAVLGGLPTHAGMVWTDDGNGATVTFTAYGVDGGIIDRQAVPGIGTPGISGETDEDRFFGVVFPGGVKRITMSHNGGGIEIDHLQIGR